MDKQKILGLAGIDRNMGTDFIIGIVIGVVILIIGGVIPGIGVIGIPDVPQSLSSDTSKFIVVVLLASIFETFAFFDIVLSFFKDKIGKFLGMKVPFIISAVLASAVFSLFHLSAYSSFSLNTGAFLSAFIMGLVFSYERKFTNSNLPGIITHAILNFWIAFLSFSIIVT